ncbi:LamB/YcsF family protein, partial [Bifidobacterium callitrichos]|uniref:LamB/YcsF family protein n=1 Tax=Bifidobacterium callitrichos TaxID=762209 RepID=UPI000A7A2A39
PTTHHKQRIAVLDGTVVAIDGTVVPIAADSVCVHGDSPAAVAMAHAIRERLIADGVTVRAFTAA